jgi:hypothetical protein
MLTKHPSQLDNVARLATGIGIVPQLEVPPADQTVHTDQQHVQASVASRLFFIDTRCR